MQGGLLIVVVSLSVVWKAVAFIRAGYRLRSWPVALLGIAALLVVATIVGDTLLGHPIDLWRVPWLELELAMMLLGYGGLIVALARMRRDREYLLAHGVTLANLLLPGSLRGGARDDG